MHAHVSALAVVVAFSFAASGCDGDNGSAADVRLMGPSPFQARLVSLEPTALVPEFLSGPSCRGLRPFRTRFNLFVHADRDLFLHGLQFDFRDRTGGRALPLAIPTTVTGPTIPNSVPLTLPSSAPIPIPGTLPFNGVMLSPGVKALGLVLNFDCGVTPDGMLSIRVETADRDGAREVSHITVRVI